MKHRIVAAFALFMFGPACTSDSAEIELEVTETNVDEVPGFEPLMCSTGQNEYQVGGEHMCDGSVHQYSATICSDDELCESALAEVKQMIEGCDFDATRVTTSVETGCD